MVTSRPDGLTGPPGGSLIAPRRRVRYRERWMAPETVCTPFGQVWIWLVEDAKLFVWLCRFFSWCTFIDSSDKED